MNKPFDLKLDRAAKAPLAEQIRNGIAIAIAEGVLQPGARLPSWQDLAAQLGVARGTVRNAYEIRRKPSSKAARARWWTIDGALARIPNLPKRRCAPLEYGTLP